MSSFAVHTPASSWHHLPQQNDYEFNEHPVISIGVG